MKLKLFKKKSKKQVKEEPVKDVKEVPSDAPVDEGKPEQPLEETVEEPVEEPVEEVEEVKEVLLDASQPETAPDELSDEQKKTDDELDKLVKAVATPETPETVATLDEEATPFDETKVDHETENPSLWTRVQENSDSFKKKLFSDCSVFDNLKATSTDLVSAVKSTDLVSAVIGDDSDSEDEEEQASPAVQETEEAQDTQDVEKTEEMPPFDEKDAPVSNEEDEMPSFDEEISLHAREFIAELEPLEPKPIMEAQKEADEATADEATAAESLEEKSAFGTVVGTVTSSVVGTVSPVIENVTTATNKFFANPEVEESKDYNQGEWADDELTIEKLSEKVQTLCAQ